MKGRCSSKNARVSVRQPSSAPLISRSGLFLLRRSAKDSPSPSRRGTPSFIAPPNPFYLRGSSRAGVFCPPLECVALSFVQLNGDVSYDRWTFPQRGRYGWPPLLSAFDLLTSSGPQGFACIAFLSPACPPLIYLAPPRGRVNDLCRGRAPFPV